MSNFQESRSAAVLQFLEKVLKLKNKSKFQSDLERTDLRRRQGGEYKKKRSDALEKLFAIAGEDWDRQFSGETWDRQFVKKRTREKGKKARFICPEANTFQHPKSFQLMGK